MSEKSEKEKSTYLYLDFGDRVSQDIFQQPVFFKIANLEKTAPLVQLNELLYKGSYDLSLGTNLFFEVNETQQIQQEDTFESKATVSLKHILNQIKVINLHPVKVRPKRAELPHQFKDIKYNFDWDYNTILEKFANGTLNLEDIAVENKISEAETEPEVPVPEETAEVHAKEVPVCEKMERKSRSDSSSKLLQSNYARLQNLARRPTRRQISEEVVAECDPKYKKAFEYHNYEKQILKPSAAFLVENAFEVNENTLSNCVDVDRCVLYGIIKPSSDIPRILTPEEKRAILNMNNFDNLSLTARYYVICCQIEQLERILNVSSGNVLIEKDMNGKSVRETLEMYNKLKNALEKRISDIRVSLTVENEEPERS